METTEVLRKQEKRFNKVRLSVKLLIVALMTAILVLQWKNIIQFLNWVIS